MLTSETPLTNEERLALYEQRRESIPSPQDKVCPGCGAQHWERGGYCAGCDALMQQEARSRDY